jgi:hypothetical protein
LSNKVMAYISKKSDHMELFSQKFPGLIFGSEQTPDEVEDHLLSMADFVSYY